jgi:hypothetical protein
LRSVHQLLTVLDMPRVTRECMDQPEFGQRKAY